MTSITRQTAKKLLATEKIAVLFKQEGKCLNNPKLFLSPRHLKNEIFVDYIYRKQNNAYYSPTVMQLKYPRVTDGDCYAHHSNDD